MSSPDIEHESSALQGFYGWTDTLKGVYYGPGSVGSAIPKLLGILGGTKALVVTGKSLYHKVSNSYVAKFGLVGLVTVVL
jgi:hypothetical protein